MNNASESEVSMNDVPPAFESALPEQIRDDALLVMDEIAASTGSWRGHISLEAALSFFDDGEVQSAYSDHVDSCAYSLIDRRRREERLISNEQFDENMIVDDRSANVEEVIMEKQLFETIFDSLESSLDKEILRARMAGSSLKEISSQTGLSYSNVGVRLHRIKQKILAE